MPAPPPAAHAEVMQKTSRVLADTAIRGAALLGGQWVFSKVWDAIATGPPGVDIGAGLVCGAVIALLVGLRGDAGLAQIVTDMLLLAPFMAALVAVPGIVGGTVVSSVRQHRDLRHY